MFVCQTCGTNSPKWIGKCNACGSWNSFIEEVVATKTVSASPQFFSKAQPYTLLQIESGSEARIDTKNNELNRVLGGGLVPGSLVLLGGEPGIGKSTLTNMVLGHLQQAGRRTL